MGDVGVVGHSYVYKVIEERSKPDDLSYVMNELGSRGWRLVEVVRLFEGGSVLMFFEQDVPYISSGPENVIEVS